MTHGILEWRPGDRIRRILVLRYKPQHAGLAMPFPDEIKAVLSPETLELIETAHYNHVKDIVKDDLKGDPEGSPVGDPEGGREDDQKDGSEGGRQGASP